MKTGYNLSRLKAPRLSGSGFKIFTGILETSFPGGFLASKLLRDSGVSKLTSKCIREDTTILPLHLDGSPVENAAGTVSDFLKPIDKEEKKSGISGFRHLSIDDYASLYREGTANPLSVAEELIRQIEKSNSGDRPLNAVIKFNREDILRQAEESRQRFEKGAPLSILDGVPIAVKDEVDLKGYTTSVGTSFLGSQPAAEDAESVRRLRDAGAILFGKTNMHEIGIGVTGLNPHYGVVRNPYNPGNYTGGSSSGSAAAVAAGLCPGAVGADGGGSIRIPAALCGVTGIKPTYARISEHGAAPLCWSVAHLGPIASSVRDTAIMYAVMAGPDKKMPVSEVQPEPDLFQTGKSGLEGLRIGYYPEWFYDCSEDIHPVLNDAVKHLEELGAEVKEIEIPELEEMRIAHLISIVSEMTTAMNPYYKEHRKDFGLDTRVNLALGRRLTNIDYIHAQRMRTRAMEIFNDVFRSVDAVITPSTAVAAPAVPDDALPLGESNLEMLSDIMRYAFPGNLTGLPALSVPIGYTEDKLPVGLQIISGAWKESLIFRIAANLESRTPFLKPELYFPPA